MELEIEIENQDSIFTSNRLLYFSITSVATGGSFLLANKCFLALCSWLLF